MKKAPTLAPELLNKVVLDWMRAVEQLDLKLIAAHSLLVVATAVATPIGTPIHAGGAVDTVAAVVAAITVTTRIAVIACGGASGIGAIARGAPVTATVDAPVVAILRGGMTNAE
jgi:hypothetical protein